MCQAMIKTAANPARTDGPKNFGLAPATNIIRKTTPPISSVVPRSVSRTIRESIVAIAATG
jgi:hypothetical protein